MSPSFVAPGNVLNPLWRTHSCVPRRHSCRRPVDVLRGLSGMYTIPAKQRKSFEMFFDGST